MKLEHIYKEYNLNGNKIIALKDINIEFKPNNFYAIMGRSGSGKSTLVNILGLLDEATSGNYYLNEKNIASLSADAKSDIIAKQIGFVFQSFYLNNSLTALENVMLPLYINKEVKKEE